MPHLLRLIAPVALVALSLPLMQGGCASYASPGGPADIGMFAAPGLTPQERERLTDTDINTMIDRKPLASFPVRIAVARVQAPGYKSYTSGSYGQGAYSLVTQRDVEAEEDVEKLAKLDLIAGIAPISGLVMIDAKLDNDKDLRQAAAGMGCGMLLVYTLDTHIYVGDSTSPLDVVTLGVLPHKKARINTTASAVLLDTRNGYFYGSAEGSAETAQLANTWNTQKAIDQARRRAEGEAFAELVVGLEDMWGKVVKEYVYDRQGPIVVQSMIGGGNPTTTTTTPTTTATSTVAAPPGGYTRPAAAPPVGPVGSTAAPGQWVSPQPLAPAPVEPEPRALAAGLVIHIAADGSYAIAGRPVSLADLRAQLAAGSVQSPRPGIVIMADPSADVAAYARLMDEVQAYGFTDISTRVAQP